MGGTAASHRILERFPLPRERSEQIVNNEVWQTGEGIVAARAMLDDLRYVNAPIN